MIDKNSFEFGDSTQIALNKLIESAIKYYKTIEIIKIEYIKRTTICTV